MMKLGFVSKTLVILLAVSTLAACATQRNKQNQKLAYVEEPAEFLYSKGQERLQLRRYSEAKLYFEEVERQHPYSSWARRAMLMNAFAKYEDNDYDEAIADLERFIAIHPGNKDAAYAYYLKAMSYYNRIVDVGRDQGMTTDALTALSDVVNRYPDSEYARDARLKIDMTHDHLAGKEMDVGRWYLKRNKHVAAINRFNTVVTNYQTTSHTPEALARMVEAYLEMGVVAEAQRHASILGYNFPGDPYYQESYRLFEKRGLAASFPKQGTVGELPEAK